MAGFTDAYASTLCDHIFRNQAYTPPSTVYIGLSTNGTDECTDANYARQAVTLSAASAGATSNTGALTYPAAAAQYNVHSAAAFTALSGGTRMTDYKALTGGTQTIAIGQQFRFPVGDVDLTID